MIRSIQSASPIASLISESLLAGRDSHAWAKADEMAVARAGFAGFDYAGSMPAMANMMDPMAQAPAGKEQNQVGRGGLAE